MKNNKTTKQIGDWGEDYAVRYLRRHGYWIKARNYRAGHYEIDIIAQTPKTLAFIEVKTRSYHNGEEDLLPPPSSAVRSDKQSYTRRAARQFLYENPTKKQPRMDVLEIWLRSDPESNRPKVLRVRHLKGAY